MTFRSALPVDTARHMDAIQRPPDGFDRDVLSGKAPESHGHFHALDSLRGLAAVVVLLHHWNILWKMAPHSHLAEKLELVFPFHLLFDGHSSVLMFFVLSGFVLALPQTKGRNVVYLLYILKRTLRIYLPYLAALCLALLVAWKLHSFTTYGPWLDQGWRDTPTWPTVTQHLLFIGNYPIRYNPVFWTLIQEMRISIIFPFLCAFVIYLGSRRAMGLAWLLILVSLGFDVTGFTLGTFADTLAYSGMFIFGILLAQFRVRLAVYIHSLPQTAYWGALLICLLIYTYLPSLCFALGARRPFWRMAAMDAPTAIAAAGIILYSLSNARISRWLSWKPILFLGRISYSLYLVHMPVLVVAAIVFVHRLSPSVWLLPYLIASVMLATGLYYLIEVPSIRTGKWIATRLQN